MPLIFVDTEDAKPTPTGWSLREFGAVEFKSRRTHGKDSSGETFEAFKKWLESFGRERKVFVSDNPAYDWAPIDFYFHRYFGENPFGHSARRIGDFYAGLVGDFGWASEWKRLRITEHDHHPVHDAMGNVKRSPASSPASASSPRRNERVPTASPRNSTGTSEPLDGRSTPTTSTTRLR